MKEVEPTFAELPEGESPIAYIISANINHRFLTKGQQAMAMAMAYPQQHRVSAPTCPVDGTGSNEVSKQRLSVARAVLAHSQTLAMIYPEPEHGGDRRSVGRSSSVTELESVTKERLSRARAVLRAAA